MADIFSELCEAAEARVDREGNTPRGGVLYARATCISSLECAAFNAMVTDPILQSEPEFIEVEIEGEWVAPREPVTPENSELFRVRSELSELHIAHQSIARSLGPETSDIYSRYAAACEAEGLVPLSLGDYKRRKPNGRS